MLRGGVGAAFFAGAGAAEDDEGLEDFGDHLAVAAVEGARELGGGHRTGGGLQGAGDGLDLRRTLFRPSGIGARFPLLLAVEAEGEAGLVGGGRDFVRAVSAEAGF